MKKKIKKLLIPVVVFALFCMGVDTFLTTTDLPWRSVGTIDSTTAGADVALGVAERDYTSATALDNSVAYDLLREINGMEVRFLLTTNNADVDIDMWLWRKSTDGSLEMARACTLDVICGQQDANGATYHYADTINVTNNEWIGNVKAIVPGTDHQARLVLDPAGYDGVLFHGYGTFDEDCIVEVSGY